MKYITQILSTAALATVFGTTGCSDAELASRNISKAADQFEINRRIVFYNGITGEYMLSIEGLCSLGHAQETQAVTVRARPARAATRSTSSGCLTT